MIVKGTDDEANLLGNCLASVADHVDGIFIDVNAPKGKKHSQKVLDVARKYNANIQTTTWEGNFVKARNDNFSRVPKEYDWIVWLDSDDTVDYPEKLKEVCALATNDTNGVYLNYDYAHDEYGNVIVSHYNARIVRNNGTFKWKSSFRDADVTVHETLNEVRSVGKAMNDEVKVIHHSDNERRDASLARNIKLLEGMYKKSTDNPDPRIVFYLATHYIDAYMWNEAKALFEQYLTMSGWAEERAQAWVYLGDIYRSREERDTARGCYMRAIAENPKDPAPYVELGELEIEDHLWEKAIEWLEMATNKEVDKTVVVLKPMEATYRAYKLLTEAYTNLGVKHYETASKWLTKALKLRPFDPELQKAREQLEELTRVKENNDRALRLIYELKKNKEYEKIVPFVDNLPLEMQESPLIHSVRNYYTEPKNWPKKSIAIVCGSSALGAWGPWSLEKGIGGSEEAVIQLSKELTKLGWKVTVFATPGERVGTHNNVEWRHYWEFNGKDTFDVLIGWRDPSFFDKAYKARKRYLWLHDVIDREELIPQRLDNLEGVIFVSQYHRTLFPEVPDNKAFASANGVDPEQFTDEVERNDHKVIYMSAHERGQELLQKIWPDVLKEIPDAELHCYYGWAGYDFVNKDNPERMMWKDRLIADQKRLKNFTDHGKVGHKEIANIIKSAGVWAYPTGFPEVYCITGVKAQLGGAWPVTSDFAVLPETVPFGDKVHIEELDKEQHVGRWTEAKLEEFTKLLVKRLKNPPTYKERKEMADWVIKNHSWSVTAKGWNEEFNK